MTAYAAKKCARRAMCAALEAEIADLEGDDKLAFLADLGLDSLGSIA